MILFQPGGRFGWAAETTEGRWGDQHLFLSSLGWNITIFIYIQSNLWGFKPAAVISARWVTLESFPCSQWFAMEDVAAGKLHLKLEWLSPLATPEKLDQVFNLQTMFVWRGVRSISPIISQSLSFLFPSQALMSIKANRTQASDGLSSALLVVFLDSARNLPVSQSELNFPACICTNGFIWNPLIYDWIPGIYFLL